MRIVHFSDHHANFRMMPEADLYVCTGDMLPNFPKFNGPWFDIDESREIACQTKWIHGQGGPGFFRKYLSSRDAQVVVVRGNHDFIDLGEMFLGDVFEIKNPGDSFVFHGLKISGARGINKIFGSWSDELEKFECETVFNKIPNDTDILITHAPPRGQLDYFDQVGNCGVDALASIHSKSFYGTDYHSLKLHCFGHIHEDGGKTLYNGKVLCSNASCNINVIDL